MTRTHDMRSGLAQCTAALAAWLSLGCHVVCAFAHARIGDVIANTDLPTLDSGRHPLLTNATVNIFIFFNPGQAHSRDVLCRLAGLEKEIAGKPVHWVAIISDRDSKADAEADVKAAGLAMPVLIDAGDALYGRLGVVLRPVVGITDKDHKLVAYQHYTKINYIEVIRARIRHLLGEITGPEMDQVLQPPPATQGGRIEVAHRHLKLAQRLLRAGRGDKAIEEAKRSIEADPSLASAHTVLGQALISKGDSAGARSAFARASELDPNDTAASDGLKSCRPKAPEPDTHTPPKP